MLVPSNSPVSAVLASETTSVDLASSKASRQSFAAARPTCGIGSSNSSSETDLKKRLSSLRWVIVAGSLASKMLSSSTPTEKMLDALSSTEREVFSTLLESGNASERSLTKNQLRVADLDHLARLERMVAMQPLVVDEGAVATVQIA